MDHFEYTKIAGAVLAALLLIFGTKAYVELKTGHGPGEKVGYALPGTEAPAAEASADAAAPAAEAAPAEGAKAETAAGGEPAKEGAPAKEAAVAKDGAPAKDGATSKDGAPAKEAAAVKDAAPAKEAAATKDGAPAKEAAPAADAKAEGGATPAAGGEVVALLAAANAENGKAGFSKCKSCHVAEKGKSSTVGPNLWGVVNRKTASLEGFNYSEGLKTKGGDWTFENLSAFIRNPKGYAPGTKMVFAGIKDPAAEADLIAYLATLADTPVALPK